jgi:tetratricopeptide (TPR) repeat protein
MKKLLLALAALVILAGGAFLAYQNLPEKRYARHMVKARLFVKQANYTAALKEYEAAYASQGGFTPYASLEVLKLTNHMNLQEKKADVALANSRKFTERYPSNEEGKLVLARLAFQVGEVEPAFEALNDLLSLDQSHFEGRMLLAQVRARQGRLDLAEEQLRVLAARHPDSVSVAQPLVQNLMQQGKFGEARGMLRRMLAANARDTIANLLLVEGFLKERLADSARIHLDLWLAADSTVAQPIAIQKSRLASMLGKQKEALDLLRPFDEGHKPPVAVLAEMALAYVKLGHIDSALKKYDAVIAQGTATRGSYMLLSHLLHLAAKNPVRALELIKTLEASTRERVYQRSLIATYLTIGQDAKIETLLASQPDSLRRDLEAFRAGIEPSADFVGGWALFNYYQMNEQPFWMLRVVDSLYKRWPNNALIARSYAAQLMGANALPQALAVLSRISPPSLEDDLRILELNRRMGKTREALAVAHRMEKQNPGHRGINALLSDIYLAGGDLDRAVQHAERELALDGTNVVCINNLAWIHGVERGDLAKAKPYLARLEKVKNTDPRVLDTMGWILAKTGKFAEAEPHFELALNIMPDNPSLLYHLAWVRAKKGDRQSAASLARKALALDTRFGEKAEAEKLLAELK